MLQLKYGIAVILAVTIFIIGFIAAKNRYDKPQQVVTKEKIHTVTRTVTVKSPDGTTRTVTEIDSSTSTEVKTKTTKNNISALVANDFSISLMKPLYGVSFTREFIGPVTIGAFGLTNGTIGVSVGLNF